MIKKMDRKKNESYLSFSKRVTRALSNKTISYKEWAKSLLNEMFKDGVIFIKASSEVCEKKGIRINSASICFWNSCISAGYP